MLAVHCEGNNYINHSQNKFVKETNIEWTVKVTVSTTYLQEIYEIDAKRLLATWSNTNTLSSIKILRIKPSRHIS